MLSRAPFYSFLLLFFLLSACRETEVKRDVEVAREAHRVMSFHFDLFPLIQKLYHAPSGPDPQGGDTLCGTLRLIEGDSSLFPAQDHLTYRYRPEDGCGREVDPDREGSLKVVFMGALEEAGSRVRIEGEAFRAGGVNPKESFVLLRGQDAWSFEWKRTRMITEGNEFTMNGSMEVEKRKGGDTDSTVHDDRYRFDPVVKGEGLGDESYRIEATEEIERDMGCRWAWKGELWVKPRDRGGRSLDLGKGESCPDSALVRVNGGLVPILLE